MSEYVSLGHMSLAKSPGCYYILHHAVCRPDDDETKIRVVFDASARSNIGLSLNSCLMPGPKLQTRYSRYSYAFSYPSSRVHYRHFLNVQANSSNSAIPQISTHFMARIATSRVTRIRTSNRNLRHELRAVSRVSSIKSLPMTATAPRPSVTR